MGKAMKRPLAVSVLATLQFGLVGLSVYSMVSGRPTAGFTATVWSAIWLALLTLTAIGLLLRIRWAYMIELGMLGGLGLGLAIIAADARSGVMATIAIGLFGVVAYLVFAGSVPKYYQRRRAQEHPT
jgi:hypothetical protein